MGQQCILLYYRQVFATQTFIHQCVGVSSYSGIDRTHLFLVFFLLFAVLERLISLGEPYETDHMVYSIIANRILEGEVLYVDVWDHKPPPTYWVYMLFQWLFGMNPIAIWVMGYTFYAITFFGCYVMAFMLGGRKAGLVAALVWTVINADIFFHGNQPNTEVFMNAALIWAMVFLLRTTSSDNLAYPVLAGILFFLASFFKMVAVVIPVFVGMAYLVIKLDIKEAFKQKVAKLSIIAGSAAALWICVFVYYLLAGHFQAFWEAVFLFNSFYAGNLFNNILGYFSLQNFIFIIPYLLLALLILTATLFNKTYFIFVGVYFLAAMVAVALPGKFFFHYYQLLMPILSVGAGVCIALMLFSKKKLLVFVFSLALLVPAVGRVMQVTVPGVLLPLYKYDALDGLFLIEGKMMSDWLRKVFGPDRNVFQWGVNAGVYFWSGHKSRTYVLLGNHHLGDNPIVNNNMARTLKELQKNRPDLIVTTDEWLTLKGGQLAVSKWIQENYVYIKGPPNMKVARFLIPNPDIH